MNEKTRDEINYFLKTSSTRTVTDLISLLKNKKITLSSSFIELDGEMESGDLDSKHVKKFLNKECFDSEDALIIALTLLNEIKNFEKNMLKSTKLVCTTPDVSSQESDKTDLMLNELFRKAQKSITIIGYLMTDDKYVKQMFEMIKSNPEIGKLKIKFIFDRPEDKQVLGKKYPSIKKIVRELWGTDQNFPKIYSYKKENSSLHAKAVIIDSKEILITSANMSGRALQRNLEMGIHHMGKSAKDADDLISRLIREDLFERV